MLISRKTFAALLLSLSTLAFKPALNAQSPGLPTFNQLVSVNVFAFGGIGYAGVTSTGEKIFWQIMALPREQSLASFEVLYRDGNPQAKSYALVGMRKWKAPRFNELARQSRQLKVQVTTENGCIIDNESLAEVVKEIEAGTFDPFTSFAAHSKT